MVYPIQYKTYAKPEKETNTSQKFSLIRQPLQFTAHLSQKVIINNKLTDICFFDPTLKYMFSPGNRNKGKGNGAGVA